MDGMTPKNKFLYEILIMKSRPNDETLVAPARELQAYFNNKRLNLKLLNASKVTEEEVRKIREIVAKFSGSSMPLTIEDFISFGQMIAVKLGKYVDAFVCLKIIWYLVSGFTERIMKRILRSLLQMYTRWKIKGGSDDVLEIESFVLSDIINLLRRFEEKFPADGNGLCPTFFKLIDHITTTINDFRLTSDFDESFPLYDSEQRTFRSERIRIANCWEFWVLRASFSESIGKPATTWASYYDVASILLMADTQLIIAENARNEFLIQLQKLKKI